MKTTRQQFARRCCFRLAAVLLGVFPFVTAELTLRIVGVAATPAYLSGTNPLSAIDQDPLVDLHALRPLFIASADGTWMEIGASRMNFFCPAEFPLRKGTDTYRVFALGGSTTQGQPYRPETALAKWFELWLRAAWPEREIEVINCGGISYASYRVAAILDEVLAYDPDLIVLYTGQNEFLEARTYARQHLIPRWAAPALATLGDLRIARVAARAMNRFIPSTLPPSALPREVDTLLDHPGGLNQYHRDIQWIQQVHAHFAVTLRRMILACQRRQVPLVICVPASDWVNTAPLKSQLDPTLPLAERQRAERLIAVMNDPRSEKGLRRAAAEHLLQIDPGYAQAHYQLGTSLYQQGDVRAVDHLLAARDTDVCPLRATAAIEQTVRQLAAEYRLPMVDTPRLFDLTDHRGALLHDGIPDPSWFVDHVHPTIEGQQAIAAEIFQQLIRDGRIVTARSAEQVKRDYRRLEFEHLVSLDESYYGRAQQRLQGVRRWTGRE